MKKLTILTAFALMIVLAAGCAQQPKNELNAATTAIDSAKVAEANRYLPDEFNTLQDLYNKANVEIEAQNSKFFLSRSYKNAAEMLNQVTTGAQELKGKVEGRKVEVRAEVQEMLTGLNTLVGEVKALFAKAPKGKEGKAALEAIQEDIAVIEASITEINTLITNGDYVTALDKTTASKEKAEAIKEELSTAISKSRRG